MVLDGSKTDFAKSKAKEVTKEPKIGRVVQVYEHLVPDDDSNFEVDVLIDGGTFEERAVMYAGESNDQIAAPMVGDKVIIDYLAGEKKRAICMGTTYSVEDRAPLGRAGMQRDVYESDESPVGPGDVTVTGYTQYTDNPARVKKDKIDPVQTWYQIAKYPQSPDPVLSDNAPLAFEVYDSPVSEEDETRIRAVGNQVDQDDKLSMDFEMNFKDGDITHETVNENIPETMTVEQNVKQGYTEVVTENDAEGEQLIVEVDSRNGNIVITGNGPGKDMKLELDIRGNGAELTGTPNDMGVELDFDSGSFTLRDGSKYGIKSDGSGNFTWAYESINYDKGGSV